jgi:myo-inositol-1(or 4)-monophosphatase
MNGPSLDLSALRHLAESTALHAGRLLQFRRADWARAESSSDHDVKLVGDRGAEAVAIGLLQAGSSLPVFSEEAGLVGEANASGLLWVLDPLDGSANYLRGVPCCCVSLALCQDEQPLLGVVHDFNRGETFSGVVGEGAWLNEKPIHVSMIDDPSRAILATGFPAALDYDDETGLREFVQSVQRYHKVRSLGTAALMLAYVACGRLDIYRERNVRFWDVAAGMALAQAAGGRVLAGGELSGLKRRIDLRVDNARLPL